MSYYIPACIIALGIRLDENFHVLREEQKPEPSPEGEAAITFFGPPPPQAESLVSQQNDGDALSWFLNIVPNKCNVDLDGYSKASKWSVTIPFQELPIDPILIKAGQIRIFFGTVNPDDFATGYIEQRAVGSRSVSRAVLRTHDEAGQPDTDLLACWGAFDEYAIKLDSKGAAVTIEGRDLRGILLDSPIDEKVISKVKLDKPINEVVSDILNQHKLCKLMDIKVQLADWENFGLKPGEAEPLNPIPSPAAAGNVTRVNKGAAGTGSGQNHPPQGNSKLNFWDTVIWMTTLVGAIPYFKGKDLIIRPVTAVYDLRDVQNSQDGFNPGVKSPFKGNQLRRLEGGRPFAIRKLVFGRNVETLSFKRKYAGGDKPKIIEVVSLNTSSTKRGKDKLLRVHWPKDVYKKALAAKSKGSAKGGTATAASGLSDSEIRRVSMPGINNEKQLEEIAKAIFESTAHMEIEGEFTTKELASLMETPDYGSDDASTLWPNDDADLLRLRPGDPIEIARDIGQAAQRQGDGPPTVNEITKLETLSFEEAVEEVARRLQVTRQDGSVDKDYNFARAVVATARNAIVETQQIWRTHGVSFQWDSGKIEIHGKFHNYIEAQYGNTSSAPAKKRQPVKKKTVPGTDQKDAVQRIENDRRKAVENVNRSQSPTTLEDLKNMFRTVPGVKK